MTPRPCDTYRADLSALLDNELTAARRAEVERHVAGCAACARELAETRSLIEALRALPRAKAPAGLTEMARRRGGASTGEAARGGGQARLLRIYARATSIAAVIGLCAFASWTLFYSESTSTPEGLGNKLERFQAPPEVAKAIAEEATKPAETRESATSDALAKATPPTPDVAQKQILDSLAATEKTPSASPATESSDWKATSVAAVYEIRPASEQQFAAAKTLLGVAVQSDDDVRLGIGPVSSVMNELNFDKTADQAARLTPSRSTYEFVLQSGRVEALADAIRASGVPIARVDLDKNSPEDAPEALVADPDRARQLASEYRKNWPLELRMKLREMGIALRDRDAGGTPTADSKAPDAPTVAAARTADATTQIGGGSKPRAGDDLTPTYAARDARARIEAKRETSGEDRRTQTRPAAPAASGVAGRGGALTPASRALRGAEAPNAPASSASPAAGVADGARQDRDESRLAGQLRRSEEQEDADRPPPSQTAHDKAPRTFRGGWAQSAIRRVAEVVLDSVALLQAHLESQDAPVRVRVTLFPPPAAATAPSAP
ncbi:MAG: zf-HC2 domain-containing protein [Phycisphaerae bacterium]